MLVPHRAARAGHPPPAPRHLARALPVDQPDGLQYSRNRTSQAPRDVEQGLQVTLNHFRTRPMQERAVQILRFKLDILWSMNDVMGQHYGTSGVTAGAATERRAA